MHVATAHALPCEVEGQSHQCLQDGLCRGGHSGASLLQAHDLREEREGLMRDVAKLRTALQEVSAAGRGAALYCMMPLAGVD